jgi:hypothetical protein
VKNTDKEREREIVRNREREREREGGRGTEREKKISKTQSLYYK